MRAPAALRGSLAGRGLRAPAHSACARRAASRPRAAVTGPNGWDAVPAPRSGAAFRAVAAPEQLSQRLKVISLVAANVQINADVARFEVFAGRSAMVGFAVAFFTELVLPAQGLFGSWRSESYSAYAAISLLLVAGAVGLATLSKRRLGQQFQEAVLTSLTALSRSASSITQRNVDCAVDYVFEQVFGDAYTQQNLIDVDDFL